MCRERAVHLREGNQGQRLMDLSPKLSRLVLVDYPITMTQGITPLCSGLNCLPLFRDQSPNTQYLSQNVAVFGDRVFKELTEVT